jgi:primase-polymerase (primpol)-like protein
MSAADVQFPGVTLRQPPIATPKPEFVVPAKYAHLPQKMQAENRFNVWRKKPRAGSNKFDKVPYNPRTNKPANSPELGVSLQEAYAAEVTGGYDGVGFYTEVPYMVCDFDDCVNAETGEIDPKALEIAATLDTFVELSISRTGLHFWMLGEKPGDACRRGNLEIYSTKRFVAIGSAMDGCPKTIEDRTKELAVVYGRMLAGDSKEVVEPFASTPASANEPTKIQTDDSHIHHSGKAITNLLTLLSTGDYTPDSKPFRVTDEYDNWVEYSSQSEAIGTLLVCLAVKHDCDPEKMEQEYLNSHLSEIPKWANGKWDRLKNDEIKSAIAKIKKTAAPSATAPAIQNENKSAD